MNFFQNLDSDDNGEFMTTFFNFVQNIVNEDCTNASNIRTLINRDRQAAHEFFGT